MAPQSEQYGGRTLPDYLTLVANVLYGLFGVAFVAGLYFDWRLTGQVVVPQFVIAHEPQPNSGLFILSFVLLAIGYVVSRGAAFVEEYRTEKVDQTQEWKVDVGTNK